ncbi:MAG: hypothetical protein ACLSX2_01160 [Christensenellaceae bacterium]
MKCTSMWSYRSYRPLDWPQPAVELMRLAPGPDYLELDYGPETAVEARWRGASQGRTRLTEPWAAGGLAPAPVTSCPWLPGGAFTTDPLPYRLVPRQVVNF